MKKIFKILLLIIFVFCIVGLAACGSGDGGEEGNGKNNNNNGNNNNGNNNGNSAAITTPEMGTYNYSGEPYSTYILNPYHIVVASLNPEYVGGASAETIEEIDRSFLYICTKIQIKKYGANDVINLTYINGSSEFNYKVNSNGYMISMGDTSNLEADTGTEWNRSMTSKYNDSTKTITLVIQIRNVDTPTMGFNYTRIYTLVQG